MNDLPDATPVDLRGEQQTMLMSLYLHAQNAQSDRPVLADRFAAPLLARIAHEPVAMKRLRGNQPLIVGRAKLIDTYVRSFLAREDHAVVLHLGCGLDSRVLRINPPAKVTWIEVDQGPVIGLRRRFYPDRDGVITIAASVAKSAWWSAVPVNRPLLVVAEGLFMYLTPDDVRVTCDSIVRHGAPTTTLVADTVAPWVRRIASWQPTMRRAATGFASTTDDLGRAMDRYPQFSDPTGTSLVTEAALTASGPLARLIGLLDRFDSGHRAMTLTTYQIRTS